MPAQMIFGSIEFNGQIPRIFEIEKMIKLLKEFLKGIKGQYLIFEENKVLNVRAHEGYLIQIFSLINIDFFIYFLD